MKNAGKHYAIDTVLTTLTTMMQEAKRKLIADAATTKKPVVVDPMVVLSFTCLDPKSSGDERVWMTGVIMTLRRKLFQRAMKDGDSQDQSAEPILPEHIQQIMTAYAREGSANAMGRKCMAALPIPCSRSGARSSIVTSTLRIFILRHGMRRRPPRG